MMTVLLEYLEFAIFLQIQVAEGRTLSSGPGTVLQPWILLCAIVQ